MYEVRKQTRTGSSCRDLISPQLSKEGALSPSVFILETNMKHSSNEIYRISKWSHFFYKGEVMAALHALSLETLFVKNCGVLNRQVSVSLTKWNSLLGQEVCSEFLRLGILVQQECNDMQLLSELRNRQILEQKLDLVYLLLTDGCNLKCTYCFEETPESSCFTPTIMKPETAVEALHFFGHMTSLHGTPGGEKIIQLYGGEPLMNKKAVRTIVCEMDTMKKAGELPLKTRLVVVTNGVLLDDELIELFAENSVGVVVSIDGPPNINNKYRIAKKDGVDVFQSAITAYRKAKERGVPIGLSITLTPEVINGFDTVLDFFINDVGIENGVGFNILHFNPQVLGSIEYFDKAADCLIRAFSRFRKLGIYEERMMRKVSAFAKQEPIYADCGVVGNQIVVAPDGKVGVCQDFVKPRTYFAGSVHDPDYDPFCDGLFDNWKRRSPMFMKECFDCPAIAVCGGGCPASIELQSGSRWNIDRRICPHSQKSLEWMVWETYALSKG